ncbi:MAG: phosphatase PAP2 family protein [Euzebya sp.]
MRTAVGVVPRSTEITRATTDLGSMFMVVSAAATLYRMGHRWEAGEVLVAGSLGWFVAHKTKKAFDRPRPYESESTERHILPPIGSSMPSGHSAVIFAVVTVLGKRSLPSRRWPYPLVAAWVPMTRIHLGVHYPCDTLIGAILGHGLGRVVSAVSRRLQSRFEATRQTEQAVKIPTV